MIVSHSMTATWRRCKHKFYLHYIQGFRQIRKGMGLQLGTLGHLALGAWYNGATEDEAIAKVWKAGEELAAGAEIDQGSVEMLERVLRRYFKMDLESETSPAKINKLGVEWKFNLPLGMGHNLLGFIDMVFERKDKTIWVMEHKFNKQASTSHLQLDPQISIYIAASRRAGIPVSGVLFNCIRMTDGPTAVKEPALRDYAFRSELAGEQILLDLGVQAEEILSFTLLNPIFQKRSAYRNCTKDCSWDCQFYRACMLSMEGEDPSPVFETEFIRKGEDPLEILSDERGE